MDELYTKDNTESIMKAFGVTAMFSVEGAIPNIQAKLGNMSQSGASPSVSNSALGPAPPPPHSIARMMANTAPLTTRSKSILVPPQHALRPYKSMASNAQRLLATAGRTKSVAMLSPLPTGPLNRIPSSISPRLRSPAHDSREVLCPGPLSDYSDHCLATPAGLGMKLAPVTYMARDGSASLAHTRSGLTGLKKPSSMAVKSIKELQCNRSTSPSRLAAAATVSGSPAKLASTEVRIYISEDNLSGGSNTF